MAVPPAYVAARHARRATSCLRWRPSARESWRQACLSRIGETHSAH